MSDYLDQRRDERDRRYEERKQQMQTTSPPRPPKKFPTPTRTNRTRPPTKRIITVHERTANAIVSDANWIHDHWPDFEATVASLAPATLRAASARDGGRSTDHPDPAASIALGHPDHDDVTEALAAWRVQGTWIVQRMQTLIVAHGNAGRDRIRLRCDGSIDPLCTNYAAPGGGGKCDRCRKADYRARHTAEQDTARDVPSDLLKNGSVEQSAQRASINPVAEILATCGACGWQAPARDGTHALQLLADHHAGDCPAR